MLGFSKFIHVYSKKKGVLTVSCLMHHELFHFSPFTLSSLFYFCFVVLFSLNY